MKIETPLLRRLGAVPFWRGSVKCLDELESVYRRAAAAAEARLRGEDSAGERAGKSAAAGSAGVYDG
jgi:hypothetical protein